MNLVTVINKQFFSPAKRLIGTYYQFFNEKFYKGGLNKDFNGKIYIYTFGEEFEVKGQNIICKSVPMVCDHAHDPRLYFYKAWAIYDAMQQDEDFMYLDSKHRIKSFPYDMLQALETQARFFVAYPKEHIPLGIDTTKRCFQEMECDNEDYFNSYCYWAAIQAWRPTLENRKFAEEYINYMKNPYVAGPSNWLENPEPDNPRCRHHRNDQSCLSILIHKYGWDQPYNEDTWAKYGDHDTVRTVQERPVIRGRQF